MKIGLDIDGTIDENIEFFRLLTNAWPGEVHVLTHRLSADGAEDQLRRWGIRYTSLSLVPSAEAKFERMIEIGISVMFDDSDEVIQTTPSSITILKPRHADNFDFADGRWLYQSHTGKDIATT